MDPTVATRAADLAAAALELPATKRQQFIEEQSGADHDLRSAALELAERASNAHEYFDHLAARSGLSTLDVDALPDEPFGPFRIAELIGEGGMGAVYLGRRSDALFDQVAAIKVLPQWYRTSTLQARFAQERQILARLNHPNIARLLDGGVSESGTPFIAMEHVDGTRIDAFCDARRSSITDRLTLFLQVCAGVEYAHRNLVVHRDIKPSNILVDAQRQVKLLDFGIAKLVDDDHADVLTRASGPPMTLRFASPETLAGQPVTTTSDVYSLGVLLYELLCGRSPYRAADGSALREAVTNGTITAPHASLGSNPQDAEQIAGNRSTSAARLSAELRGDLGTILTTSLGHKPNERYGSVSGLAADIERYLGHHPIEARQVSNWYRLRKFYRRNRIAVGAGVFAAVALCVALLVTALYAVSTSRQSAVIAQERDRAEQIQSFLVNVFALSAPDATKGESITAKQLLDEGTRRLETELAEQPGTLAEVKQTIASVYAKLSLLAEAEVLLLSAVPQLASAYGNASSQHAAALEQLAEVVEMQGRYDDALALAQQSLAIAETNDDRRLIARCATRVARIIHLKGEFQDAKPLYERALGILEALDGVDGLPVAETLLHYGSLLQHLRDSAAAAATHRRALRIFRDEHGALHTMTMSALVNLGAALIRLEDYDAAVAALTEARDISYRLLGEDHPDNRYVLNHLAQTYMRMDRLRDAITYFESARDLVARTLGKGHPDYGLMLKNLGDAYLGNREYAAALTTYREAKDVLNQAMPDSYNHWDVYRNLAATHRLSGDPVRAESYVLTSVEEIAKRHGETSAITQRAIAEAVAVYEALGKPKRAATFAARLPADYREVVNR